MKPSEILAKWGETCSDEVVTRMSFEILDQMAEDIKELKDNQRYFSRTKFKERKWEK